VELPPSRLFPSQEVKVVKIAVPKERMPGENRVALVPESVGRLVRAGASVWIEKGAGAGAWFADEAYEAVGATIADGAALYADAQVVACVQRPSTEEAERIASGSVLICLLPPSESAALVAALDQRGIWALALERVPRITRAQSMDVLSSQATVAGYKAVLLGAASLPKFLPMLTTAAGSIAPAKAFIIGAGVAGLQAIATARRLGAVVSGFDIRPAAAEQVQSLGASFVGPEALSEAAETKGGYAREQSQDEQQRTLNAIGAHIKEQDLVVTTAQIPGRPAPKLITEEMIRSMRPGSVIVDLAAEMGGNCVLTRPGDTVEVHGVQVMGPLNLPSTLPMHASQMFSRNVLTLLQHLIRDGEVHVDPADEITGAMLLNPREESAVAKA
jgi:H+-translocating NAD(P) transhydrogenase subunit alpha